MNGVWQVAEYAADVGQLDDLECGIILDGISEVLTLAHDEVNSYEALGFREVDDRASAVGGASSSSSSMRQSGTPAQPSIPPDAAMIDPENYVAPQPGDGASNVGPAAAGEAEALVDDRPELNEPFSVLVDGVTLDSSVPLATIRDACSSLGLGRSGGTMKCLERLKKHLESQELAAQHSAEIQLRKDDERVAQSPPIPTEPSDEERKRHMLTHQPYATWCEVCVSNRGRQDGHRPHPEPSSGASVVSFDFGFLSRLETEDDPKLVALYVCDQHSKLVHVVPTPSKDGRHLRYLTTELCRFVVYTQHTAVTTPILLCTTKYYSVLHSTTPVLLCTTKYYSSTTLYYNVLQSTTPLLLQYYSVLQSTTPYYSSTTLYYTLLQSTTPYYTVLLQYYSVLQSTTPVLLCTTKYYSSTTLYYKYYSSTTLYYKALFQYYSVLQSTTPVLPCTTKYYSSTTLYYKVLLQYYSVLQSTTLYYKVLLQKYNISCSGYHSKFHRILRLPRKVTLELHQILRLPRKVNVMINPLHT